MDPVTKHDRAPPIDQTPLAPSARTRARPLVSLLGALCAGLVLPGLLLATIGLWQSGMPLSRLLAVVGGFGAAMLLLSGALAAVFGRRITAAIAALADQAKALGRGGPQRTVETPIREVNRVGDVLARSRAALRDTEKRFRLIFSQANIGISIARTDGVMIDANPGLCQMLGCTREELMSRSAFELTHPDDRDETLRLVREIVAGTRDGYRVEKRFIGKDSRPIWVDVSVSAVRDASNSVLFGIAVAQDITARKQAEAALRARSQELQTVLDTVPVGVWFTRDPKGEIVEGNRYVHAMVQMPLDGDPRLQVSPQAPLPFRSYQDGQEISPSRTGLFRALAGEDIRDFNRTLVRADGTAIEVTGSASPLRDADGNIVGAVAAAIDVTEQKRREKQVRLIMRELTHRSKNLLAVIQGIARQTAKRCADINDFERRFNARIASLAHSHDLLVQQDWQGVAMAELVKVQLEPFVEDFARRVSAAGPALLLTPEAAQNVGLALHELATNAAKYGSLSAAGGLVEVAWQLDPVGTEPRRFHLSWRESGGSAVAPPKHQGFGRIVLERIVAQALEAAVAMEFERGGVIWQLSVPDKFVVGASAAKSAAH